MRTIMSPRLTSTSSSRVRARDWPAKPSSRQPSEVWMDLTVEGVPEGRTTTSSPGLMVPEAIRPAKPRKSRWGRRTYWTGNRKSIRLRSEVSWRFSRWWRRGGPSYQGMSGLFSRTLSPRRAETGMKVRSPISSFSAKVR